MISARKRWWRRVSGDHFISPPSPNPFEPATRPCRNNVAVRPYSIALAGSGAFLFLPEMEQCRQGPESPFMDHNHVLGPITYDRRLTEVPPSGYGLPLFERPHALGEELRERIINLVLEVTLVRTDAGLPGVPYLAAIVHRRLCRDRRLDIYSPEPVDAAAASAILFAISALRTSRLKLAPFCIGG